MTPYLKQAARHYFMEDGLEDVCFIFPNRRSASFFKKYIAEEVAARGTIPQAAPATITINDFFYRASGKTPTDKIRLLAALYDEYCALIPHPESLDDFIFWGDVLLSDFDDVDKYLVNAGQLFTNVSDYRQIRDDFSYLTDSQREAMERFLGHFVTDEGAVKEKFLGIWDILGRLYDNFGRTLSSRGMCYEGQVYRFLAERIDSEPVVDILGSRFRGVKKFTFVGLNALNECEKKVMRRMRDAKIAEFCWDWSSEMIKDKLNRSSFFMEANVQEFPQAFTPDPEGLGTPEVNVLSVPSSIGQAKQLPEIFRRLDAHDIETAVVLPEESLLIPVLNSIPDDIGNLNVTMGYPARASELWSLIKDMSAMQNHLRRKDGLQYFYHRQVWAIFSNAVLKSVLSDEGRRAVEQIRQVPRYYVCEDDFGPDPVLKAIFKAVTSSEEAGPYLMDAIRTIAPLLKANPDMAVEIDFAKLFYEAAERLDSMALQVKPSTWFKLFEKLMDGASVAFEGQPLCGLQIMGPLETRALDFENIIILSCNEGIFPRRSVSSSFIPPMLRKGFGLPTYEHQDTVWAYYFYRLIQRASRLWLLFDSRTEGLRGGEPSRYIRQLEMHFRLKANHFIANAPICKKGEGTDIEKTPQDVEKLRAGNLSASALQNYLSCPVKFYYQSVCGLREQEEVAESLDSGMQGQVFHSTMEELYQGRKKVTRADLRRMIADKEGISAIVSRNIMEQLNSFEVTGRNIIYRDVVCSYVLQALKRDLQLLDRYGVEEFRILGLEMKEKTEIGGFTFVGFLDRLDSFDPSELRVVDYKTGKVTDEDFRISSDNAAAVVEKLFGSDNGKRPKIALQLYLYDRFIGRKAEFRGLRIVNSIYQTARLFVNEVENVSLDETFCSLMDERLDGLLAEIADTSVPWKRCSDAKTCEYCDFKMICGR